MEEIINKTMECMKCGKEKHVNDFTTPDDCNECFDEREINVEAEVIKKIADDGIILSVSKDDNNNFNNHSIRCTCLECSDVAFRKLE